MPDTLLARGISQRFGERAVLDGVDLTVTAGRVTGLVGPNGAGKTTLMRILFGVIEPDAGTLEWRGHLPTDADRRAWGYMPQERGLYRDMRVLDQLVWIARLHGLDAATGRRRAVDLLERLGLAERSNDEVEKLSGGMAQRVQLAAAMVHGPERYKRRGEWTTGILCDLTGDMSALVGVMMSERTRVSIIRMLCGDENPPREIAASALTEFGNILVSQTASAIADTLGGRILPSIPELVFTDAETALQVRMSPRRNPDSTLYIESELFDHAAELIVANHMTPEELNSSTPRDMIPAILYKGALQKAM